MLESNLVKPARLHFARTARALCERGVVSEFSAARARGSYWFDKIKSYSMVLVEQQSLRAYFNNKAWGPQATYFART